MDSSTTQRITVNGGRMSIAGLATRFVQVPERRLKLEAIGLEALSGYRLRDGALVDDSRIVGQAWLPQDGLGRAGLAERADSVPLTVRPLPAGGTASRILLVLGHGEDAPEFHATIWLPADIFAAMREAVEAGRAGRLGLVATTNLWIDESERNAPADRPVTWLLGPEAEGDGSAPARGLAETIEWGPEAPPAAPEPVEASEEAAEPASDVLRRINWSLKQIVLLLLFLLIVAALK
jgi:hypothetical protein